jgi:hypothetical protein
MNERKLADEWRAMRRRSLSVLPVAIALLLATCGVVLFEGLHLSDVGFIPGVLVGTFGYWAVLEAMTVIRVGRLLQAAEPDSMAAVRES